MFDMFTIETGSGFWNPLIWVIVAIVILFVAALIRSFGKKTYKKDTDQVKSFLSGNVEYPKDQMHVKASNLYWGFTVTFRGLYTRLRKMHNGNASDYVLWFVIVLALFLLIEVI